jgi:hypothetical protein
MKAVNLNEILFPVFINDNPMPAVSAQSKQVIGVIDGIETVLNTCSPTYKLIDNATLFPAIETTLINGNVEFESRYKANDDMTVFSAEYFIKKVNGVSAAVNVGTTDNPDMIFPRLSAGNSYNGFKIGSGLFGWFRMVCTNGLVIPVKEMKDQNKIFKGKHTAKLAINFDQLIESIDGFIKKSGFYSDRFKVMADTKIENWTERLEAVLEASNVKTSKEQLATIESVIRREASDLYGGKVNEWLIYNGINHHIYKGETSDGNLNKRSEDVRRKMDEKVLETMLA